MSKTSDKILQTIRTIETRKRDANKHPTHALYLELLKEMCISIEALNKGLNELIKNGAIEWGNTINDKYLRTPKTS